MAIPVTTPLLNPNDTLLSMSDDGSLISYVEASAQGLSLFVRNLTTNQTQLITPIAAGGAAAVGGVLSANGRYLFYQNTDLLVKDLQSGTTRDVTPQLPASQGNLPVQSEFAAQAISDDGSTIVFGEEYTDFSGANPDFYGEIVANVANGSQQQFASANSSIADGVNLTPDGRYLSYFDGGYIVRDLNAGSSFRPDVLGVNGSVSDNGRYVFFTALSNASGQPASTGTSQVFIQDTTLPPGVSAQAITTNGFDQLGNGNSGLVALSGDGRHVVFESSATNMLPSVTDGEEHLYVKNLDTGAIQLLPIAPSQTVFISYNGSRIVAQESGGATQTDYAPPKLTVSPVSGDDRVNAKEAVVTVSGTSDAFGQTVHLSLEGATTKATAVVQQDGTWSTVLNIGPPKTDGVYTIDASVTDEVTTTTTHPFTFDKTPPSLTIHLAGDNFVNAVEAPSFRINGFASDGSTNPDGSSDELGQLVHVSIDNKPIGTPQIDRNGDWTLQYDGSALAEGQHEAEFSVADQAGNVTNQSSYFDVDKTPPKVAIASVAGDDVVDPSEIQGTIAIVGTSDAIGQTVTITAANKVRGSAVVQSDGSWVANVSLAGANGSVIVFAEVPDEAGNIGAATQSAVVDSNILRASVASDGAQATGDPDFTYGFLGNSVSADGRYVLFGSDGNTSIAGTPYTSQEMLKDLTTGTLTAVGTGYDGVISRDGHFAAYMGSNGYDVVNLATGTVAVANTTATGATDNGGPYGSGYPALSDDGRYVTFTSTGTNLVPDLFAQDALSPSDRVFVKDMQTGAVSLVSFAQQDTLLPFAQSSGIADGRYVAFESTIPAASSDTNATPAASDYAHLGTDIFLRDIQTGAVTLVSATPSGTAGNLSSYHPAISPDGRYVAFYSYATNLVAGQTITTPQAYLRDLQTGTTTLLSAAPDGTPVGAYAVQGGPAFVFTADDSKVAFYTAAKADPADTNNAIDVYIKDLQTGALTLASSGGPGPTSGSDAYTFNFDLTPDGHYATFSTNDPNLVTGDTNGFNDIFVRRLVDTDTLTLNAVTSDNVISGSERSATLAISGSTTIQGGTVSVMVDGTQAATAAVGSNGLWSTTIDATVLSTGRHAIAATVQDAAGFSVSTGALVSVVGAQQGKVIDGYLKGATVFTDANGNGALDAGEASAVTDGTGGFAVPTGAGPLISTGGTDTATGLAFGGQFTAPTGSTVVSPLTTLVEKIAEASGNTSAAGISAANARVVTALGLVPGTDLTQLDAVAGAKAGTAAGETAFQAGSQLLDAVTLITAAGGFAADAYVAVAAKVAAAAGTPVDLADPTTLQDIGQAAGLTQAAANAVASIVSATAAALAQKLSSATTPVQRFVDVTGSSIALQGNAATSLSSLGPTPTPTQYNQAATTYSNNLSTTLDAAISQAQTNDAPCYCRGTQILTAHGEVAVEDLAIGDLVVTTSGEHRPIRWIGHRSLDITRHPDPASVWPVLIKADSFGPSLPHRDLCVSPRHALFVDDVLIPAIRLSNGRTVVQVKTQSVTYWHIELDSHDVILAEGLPAESYVDCGNRSAFANGGGVLELHPDFEPRTIGDMCAPLMENGREVATAKRRLLDRAESLGHATTDDAALHIQADGVTIQPERLDGNRFGFDLPADAKDISLVSRTWCPAHLNPASGDRRNLGVLVTRLEIDGKVRDLADLSEGWLALDGKPENPCRWTSGTATLPPGAKRILVRIGGTPRYWTEPNETKGLEREFQAA